MLHNKIKAGAAQAAKINEWERKNLNKLLNSYWSVKLARV